MIFLIRRILWKGRVGINTKFYKRNLATSDRATPNPRRGVHVLSTIEEKIKKKKNLLSTKKKFWLNFFNVHT
jgi:hypothetical protein